MFHNNSNEYVKPYEYLTIGERDSTRKPTDVELCLNSAVLLAPGDSIKMGRTHGFESAPINLHLRIVLLKLSTIESMSRDELLNRGRVDWVKAIRGEVLQNDRIVHHVYYPNPS